MDTLTVLEMIGYSSSVVLLVLTGIFVFKIIKKKVSTADDTGYLHKIMARLDSFPVEVAQSNNKLFAKCEDLEFEISEFNIEDYSLEKVKFKGVVVPLSHRELCHLSDRIINVVHNERIKTELLKQAYTNSVLASL